MVSFDEPVVAADALHSEASEPIPDPAEVLRAAVEQARAQGLEEGRAQGRQEGLKQGLAEGREQGIAVGHGEGLRAGQAEGLKEGREQGRQEALHLNNLLSSCASSLHDLEEQMGQSLLTLALDIANQVLRTTLAEQPEAMLPAVREVLHMNPTGQQGMMRLWVHPDDLELVRLHLADEIKEANWRLLADESITRGGCRAETPYGDIDATLHTRWRRVAASLGRVSEWNTWDEQAAMTVLESAVASLRGDAPARGAKGAA
jgi:flagellar assembly protein FliH